MKMIPDEGSTWHLTTEAFDLPQSYGTLLDSSGKGNSVVSVRAPRWLDGWRATANITVSSRKGRKIPARPVLFLSIS
ncbi:hypothetical protein CYMTET_4581 [Cymbomonas tetramitiformis]|uniref:Uncharacterized protein n=1 Tax=Cymbomonas tetramitiformis TaxID=36881 RepID=A0AAE0LJZ1_9CHLO|nr:hypothetical protein CYMTET_4581 [Cymbomonas tetramitiformis]